MQIALGLFDYISVIVFLVCSILLIKNIYKKIDKVSFILLIVGTSMLIVNGILKATNKLIIGINGNDIVIFRSMFFFIQFIGFSIIFYPSLKLFRNFLDSYKSNSTTLMIAPVPLIILASYLDSKVYKIAKILSMLFLLIVVISIMYFAIIVSIKINKKLFLILYISGILLNLSMIYFAMGDVNEWVKESFNTLNTSIIAISIFFYFKNTIKYLEENKNNENKNQK